ncbi:kinesin-like protein KIN-7C, mitochondrial isoform X2 [Salvia divinorum]|uniref:Kinesin-like protein KIN-7C, mitochondrial isoform X2 n=1 Tax=Salvia divinorum TaxID=28513 RepID=A0ABD1HLZ8_SALDI
MKATEIQETITLLSQQPDSLMSNKDSSADSSTTRDNSYGDSFDINNGRGYDLNSCDEISLDKNTPTSFGSLNRYIFNHENCKECICGAFTKSQLLAQAAEIESLKQDKVRLVEEKNGLEIHCQKQTEEASYTKELAAAAAVELRNLAEEVTMLSYQNAKLTADLVAGTDTRCKPNFCQKYAPVDMRQNVVSGSQSDPRSRNKQESEIAEDACSFDELKVHYQSERRKFRHLDGLNMRSMVSGHYFGMLPQKFLGTH